MLDADAKLGPVEGYDLEEMDDELVLYHAESETIFHCNATAALVYRLCDGSRSVRELGDLLKEAYPDAAPRIESEVAQALEALVEHGALAVV